MRLNNFMVDGLLKGSAKEAEFFITQYILERMGMKETLKFVAARRFY